jgi:ankyrin repeat protein
MASLTIATRNNDVKLVKLLIASGVDVNVIEEDDGHGPNYSPLKWACLRGSAECAKMLLEAKADPNATNVCFETPLQEASFAGQVECVKLLIAHKANVNAQNNQGDSSLHFAVFANSCECTKELVQAGAELETISRSSNRTPLADAIYRRRCECTEYLLDVGAKPPFVVPSWATVMVTKRRNALSSTWAFLGVLRKRVRIYKDMATLLAKYLWSTRFEVKWE